MASTPFSETKAPESAERLHRGALSLVDISASTMANIGPAYSFFFGFGLIVITAGIGAPLTIVAAGGRHRAARQHAVPVFPGPALDRGVHHLRRQEFRRDERGDDRLVVRGGVHHRDFVGAGRVGLVPGLHALVLPGLEHPVDHPVDRCSPRGRGDDAPRGRRVRPSSRAFSSVSRCWSWSSSPSCCWSRTAATCPPRRSSRTTSPTASPAWRPASRWPSTCSSAGRTRPRWPRKPVTRGATCRGRCSCPSR